jgi:hypothetical protein
VAKFPEQIVLHLRRWLLDRLQAGVIRPQVGVLQVQTSDKSCLFG